MNDEEIALSLVSENRRLRRLGINPDQNEGAISAHLRARLEVLLEEERQLRLARAKLDAENQALE